MILSITFIDQPMRLAANKIQYLYPIVGILIYHGDPMGLLNRVRILKFFLLEPYGPMFSNKESIDDPDCAARIREITSCTIDHTIMRE